MSTPNDFDTPSDELFSRSRYTRDPVDFSQMISDISSTIEDVNNLIEDNIQKSDIVVEKASKNKKKCGECKCKLSLVQRECGKCLCGGVYCSKHSFAEQHSCSYDYKTDGKKLLKKRNPRIVADKLNKI